MKTPILIFLSLFLSIGAASGQDSQPIFGGDSIARCLGMRLHNTFSIGRSKPLGDPDQGEKSSELLSPSAGVFWTDKKGNLMELQVTRMRAVSHTGESYVLDSATGRVDVVENWRQSELDFALRWEMLRQISAISGEKLKFWIGFGTEAFIERSRSQPLNNSLEFGTSNLETGISGAVSARMSYSISPRWALDCVIPFNLMRFSVRSTSSNDPQIPLAERTLKVFGFDMFPSKLAVRLGISATL